MAKIDYYIIATDYARVEYNNTTANWIPSAYQIYSEQDWWADATKIWAYPVKKKTAKVV